jgi:hypothetical protein
VGTLLSAALPFAQQMLEGSGEFFPFAVGLSGEGETRVISGGPDVGVRADSSAVRSLLIDGLGTNVMTFARQRSSATFAWPTRTQFASNSNTWTASQSRWPCRTRRSVSEASATATSGRRRALGPFGIRERPRRRALIAISEHRIDHRSREFDD